MATVPLMGGSGLKTEPIESPELCDVLDDLAASAGGDAKIIIYRQNDRAKLEYLETVQLAVMSAQGMAYIQRKWGGGDYRLQVHGRKENGRSGIIKPFDVCIGDLPVQPTPAQSHAQTVYAQQPPSGWDSDKIIAVLTAAAPLVRAGAEWWSSRQPVTVHPYTNPVQQTSGIAALSEAMMTINMMRDMKGAVKDFVDDMASDNGGNQRSTMLQALAPALGAMLGQQQPTQAPAPVVVENVQRETNQEEGKDELNEPNEYETVLALIAESIKAGNQDTVIALLEECSHDVSDAILKATGMQIAMFAGRFGVSVTAVKESLANAREMLNETPTA